MISKGKYRNLILEKRETLPSLQLKNYSEKILDLIKDYNLTNKTIHIFLPIHNSKEINTWPIFEYLLKKGNKIGTSITKFKPKRLEHTFIDKTTTYQIDDYGIPVPQKLTTLNEDAIDIVLIPLLACDYKGNRIGYGAGFYDSFLTKCSSNCIKIGLSLFEPINETFPTDSWDIKLDQLIYPNGIVTFK